MIKILVDWKEEGNFFLPHEFSKLGITLQVFDIPNYNMKDRIKKHRIFFLYIKYIKLAFRALLGSKKNELIICWNFTTSIALGYLCKIFRKQRKILALNIIAHKKSKILEIFRRLIFSPVMKMDNYFITVNSEQYIRDYALRFKISVKKFFLLNDPFQEKDIREFKYQRSYIFVGGEAQRDWDTLFQAAQHLPEIKFVCVARKKYFKSNLFIPSNVTLLFDLDSKSFYEYMDNSSIVVIPLKSELPAGLIILLKAASMRKPIIATATPAISNYIINEESGLLFKKGNVLELVEAINKLYFDKKKQEYVSNKLLDNVMFYHSPSKYTERLIEIITELEANNNI